MVLEGVHNYKKASNIRYDICTNKRITNTDVLSRTRIQASNLRRRSSERGFLKS
jgi:hypothetical protein